MNEDGVKISQLPVADKLADGDVVAGVSEGETKAFPVDLLKGQTIEIAQEGGESATAVMSQKATTDAVAAETEAREEAVSAEATARTEAIQSLQSSVEANTTAISAETTARETADQSEATAREQAISALQTQVQTDLQNYYTKTQTDQMVSAIPKFAISVVQTLPTENISTTTVYLVTSGEESPNMYVEWIYAGDKWEELGAQTVDLTDYYTKTEADGAFVAKSDFTITADGQTKANNLLNYIVSNIAISAVANADVARLTKTTLNLTTGEATAAALPLPMSSTTQAGCVTAEDKGKIDGACMVVATNPALTSLVSVMGSEQKIATFVKRANASNMKILLGRILASVSVAPDHDLKVNLSMHQEGVSIPSYALTSFTIPAGTRPGNKYYSVLTTDSEMPPEYGLWAICADETYTGDVKVGSNPRQLAILGT